MIVSASCVRLVAATCFELSHSVATRSGGGSATSQDQGDGASVCCYFTSNVLQLCIIEFLHGTWAMTRESGRLRICWNWTLDPVAFNPYSSFVELRMCRDGNICPKT